MVKGITGVYHENGKYAISKEVGEMDFKYDSVDYYGYSNDEYYFFVSYESKWGIVDSENRVIIPFEYEYMCKTYYNHREGNFCVVQKNGKLGTIDLNNETIIPFEYDAMSGWCEHGPEGHYVSKDEKFGLITPTGELIIPVIYDGIFRYSSNYFVAKKGAKCGVINSKLDTIISFDYDLIFIDFDWWGFDDEHRDKFIVKKNDSWSYLGNYGQVILENVSEKGVFEEYPWIKEVDNLKGSPCLIWVKD